MIHQVRYSRDGHGPSPTCVIFPPLLQLAIPRKQAFEYDSPSDPQTGSKFNGQKFGHCGSRLGEINF